MITCRVDTSTLKRKLKAAAQSSPEARRVALGVAVGVVLDEVARTARRDTNRYANAWAQAGNQVGLGPFTVRPLNRSSKWTQIRYALEKQYQYWAQIDATNRRTNRQDKYARRAAQKLERAREELRRFYQSNSVVGIGIYTADYEKRAPVRALPKTYGGLGAIITIGDSTYYKLVNREPHASMVERNFRTMASARRKFSGVGLRHASKAYLARVRERSGFAVLTG